MDCSQLKKTLTRILDLQTEFTTVYFRVDESLGRQDPENMQAILSSISLMEEIRLAIIELKSLLQVSLKQAENIMNREGQHNFMGPEQVKIAFGIELKPEQIPQIPFSKEELERARELGQFLVLRVSQVPYRNDPSKVEPLTMKKLDEILSPKFQKQNKGKVLSDIDRYKNEDSYTKETPQAGWALVSKDVIPHSYHESGVKEYKDYIIQTEKLIKYLENKVFQNQDIPEIYEQAIKEFNQIRQQEKLDELITQNRQEAAQILENLQITQLVRQSPVEILYDLMINFQNTGQRLLKKKYTWSRRRSSDGWLFSVGFFGTRGVMVSIWRPFNSDKFLGVCFSRRV